MKNLRGSTMRKLFVVVAGALLLLGVTQLPAQAGGTEATGTVSGAPFPLGIIPGLPIGDVVAAEWKPVIGATGEIDDQTNGTQTECTAVAGTSPAPSNTLRCVVTESDIAGISVGDTLEVVVNFSPTSATIVVPGLGGSFVLAPNQVCIYNVTTAQGSDFDIARLEAH